MKSSRHSGLFAAVLTPFNSTGQINLEPVSLMVDWLIRRHVGGLFVCGTTGEGISLSTPERQRVLEAYAKAAAGRVPVIAHVGHNSIAEACALASHAEKLGVDAFAAAPPSFFPITDVSSLVETMASIASAAPNLPFYYYHIPSLTNVRLSMVQFLELGAERIPNLAGIKFTAPELDEFHECLKFAGGRFQMMWGRDEMLLSAISVGATAAIGSSYNIASPLYMQLMQAAEKNDWRTAADLQYQAVQMIRMISSYPYLPALKTIINRFGFNYGNCRAPLPCLSEKQVLEIKRRIDSLPFLG